METDNAIKQYKKASRNEIKPPISVLYFLNKTTNTTILIAIVKKRINNGIIIPTGLISATYIIIKRTIDTTPIINPDFRAEMKSVFFVSISQKF